VAPLRALIPDFAALFAAPGDPATARIERRPPSGDRLGRGNGSQRSSGGSAAPLHPANPVQSRERKGTSAENSRCCEKSSKLSP
jgi:hypothetical protein